MTIFHETKRIDLIDKLQRISSQQIPIHQPQLASHSLDWYGSYLKKQYVEVLFTLQVSANKWSPDELGLEVTITAVFASGFSW